MKQLFIRHEPSQIFFQEETTNEQIRSWIKANLSEFNLNEEHSCTVVLSIAKDRINIDGDEDWVKVEIKKVVPKGVW